MFSAAVLAIKSQNLQWLTGISEHEPPHGGLTWLALPLPIYAIQ